MMNLQLKGRKAQEELQKVNGKRLNGVPTHTHQANKTKYPQNEILC